MALKQRDAKLLAKEEELAAAASGAAALQAELRAQQQAANPNPNLNPKPNPNPNPNPNQVDHLVQERRDRCRAVAALLPQRHAPRQEPIHHGRPGALLAARQQPLHPRCVHPGDRQGAVGAQHHQG